MWSRPEAFERKFQALFLKQTLLSRRITNVALNVAVKVIATILTMKVARKILKEALIVIVREIL